MVTKAQSWALALFVGMGFTAVRGDGINIIITVNMIIAAAMYIGHKIDELKEGR